MTDLSARGTLTIASAEVCDRGKVREENQDNVRSARVPLGELFIVADGIGGYQGGATASRMVVEGFMGQLAQRAADYPAERALQEACTYTNMSIFRTAGSSDPTLHRMGSTVVLALIQLANPEGPTAWIGHVGDSRAYLVRNGRMQKITNDHSAVQSLLSRQLITEEEARNHPDASVLTRSLGHRPEVEIEIDRVPLQPGDALLLCSDGLWGYVLDADIAAVVTESNLSVETIADTLLHQALAAGGQDNIGIEFARLSDRNARAAVVPPTARATQAETPSKRGIGTQQTLAIALLLFGACGYLAYSAVKGDWLHLSKAAHSQSQSASAIPTPPADPADSSASKPNLSQDDRTTPDRAALGGTAAHAKHDTAAAPQTASTSTPIPTPVQAPAPSTHPSPANSTKGTVAVVGDLEAGRRELPTPPGTRRWKRVAITRENNAACVNHEKERPQIYAGSNVNMVEALEELPDVGSHLKGVEQHEMTPQIRKDCGSFDAVIFLANKHGMAATAPQAPANSTPQ